MRCELGCLSGISPVLLIALVSRILLNIALAILLTEVARAIHVSVSRRVVGNVRSALRTFRAAVFRRDRWRLCGHELTPSWDYRRSPAQCAGAVAGSPPSPAAGNDRVHQRRADLLHFRDGAGERGCDIFGPLDRPFRVPAERAGESGEVRRRIDDVLADMGALHR